MSGADDRIQYLGSAGPDEGSDSKGRTFSVYFVAAACAHFARVAWNG